MGGGQLTDIIFCNNINEIPENMGFNLLVTNSLLHHLPQPLKTIAFLGKLLAEDCFYIMGHEPSGRFYKNTYIIKRCSENSIFSKNLRRLMNVKKYPQYLKKVLRIKDTDSPYYLTAIKTIDNGLFELMPTNEIIDRIIDCYVPHDTVDADNGQGFDFKSMELHKEWDLVYSKTYNFLPNIPCNNLNKRDKKLYESIEKKYPDDGNNFCCLWKRKMEVEPIAR